MIPIGWSVGDIIAGITVVWNVYNSVSDGPLNAKVEARQFFQEVSSIVGCLEDWDRRKDASQRNNYLLKAHEELKDQCISFVEKHMRLIQAANPSTKASREGRSTWLKVAKFTGQQIRTLYEYVEWPLERQEVARIKEKLLMFLQVAIYDVTATSHSLATNTNEIVRDLQDIQFRNSELVSSNHKLVTSHLELVSLITLNLKRVTHPLESGNQVHEIDYPMLRQFEQALLPPQPLRAIEASPGRSLLSWRLSENDNAEVSSLAPFNLDSRTFGQNENDSDLMSRRLDNLSMRIGPRRVETIDTISSESSTVSREGIASSVIPLIQRLSTMRNQLGYAVGIQKFPTLDPENFHSSIDPQNTLEQEINAWNMLGERIEREILHPGHLLTEESSNSEPQNHLSLPRLSNQMPRTIDDPATTAPIPIQPNPVSNSPLSGSPPGSSFSPRYAGSMTGSPTSDPGYLSSSPNHSRPPWHIRKSSSTTSASPPASILLPYQIPVRLLYGTETIKALIHSTTRFEDGDLESITSWSQNGLIELRHAVDLTTPNLFPSESSLKPFLDNTHIDKVHRFRVQFQGAHSLKITKGGTQKKIKNVVMIYQFYNEKDFIQFQELLFSKEIKCCKDVLHIKSKDKEAQCREGTIHLLLDPHTKQRSILYFRTLKDPKQAFVEWPVNLFKDPKEPKKNGTTLTLESVDGRSLPLSKSLSRRGTQGSVTTISSIESSTTAFTRLDNRTPSTKSIKGLIIEFYDVNDCHEFWKEFREKDVQFRDSGMGLENRNANGIGTRELAELHGDGLFELAA